MGSSPETERFGISDADYEYMMNPLGYRNKRSKKQQIYGVFASDSETEEEKSGLSGRISDRKLRASKYGGSIQFVSGGVKGGTKNDSSEEQKSQPLDDKFSDEEEDKQFFAKQLTAQSSDEDDSIDLKPRHKLKNAANNPFLGSRVFLNRAVRLAQASSAGATFGSWEKHTKGIGIKLLEQMGFEPGKGLGRQGQGIVTPVETKLRIGKGSIGYMGSEISQAPRKGDQIKKEDSKRLSVDADNYPRYKKKTDTTNTSRIAYKTIDEIISGIAPPVHSTITKKQGPFLENSEMSRVKVIDMTSREQRVYTGYEAALSRITTQRNMTIDDQDETGPDAQGVKKLRRIEGTFFDVPVLRHNINLLVESIEDEVRRCDRSARFEEDRAAGLEHEIDRLNQVIELESQQKNELRAALDLIDSFESTISEANKSRVSCKHGTAKLPSSSFSDEDEELDSDDAYRSGLPSDECAIWLNRVRKDCGQMAELPSLMMAFARPLIDAALKGWRPLKDPTYCVDVLTEWRTVLGDSDAFSLLLENVWLPHVRRGLLVVWDPHDCEPVLALLEAWRHLIPEEMLRYKIIDGIILPKLQYASEAWDPLSDRVPVHTWLHPWLPWFSSGPSSSLVSSTSYTANSMQIDRLETVHSIVRTKLASCLSAWHPSDASAHAVLLPWRGVFSPGEMAAFLQRHIVPKLIVTLQNFQINPAKQSMEAWHWVMRWSDLLGPAPLANLLERCFLPRWLATLSAWLTQALAARRSGDVTAGRVFNEVASWYAGWKAQLPVEVTGYLGVREALSKALSMMDRAMRGLPPQELSAPTAPFGVPGQFPASTPGQVAHLRGPAGLAHLALSQRNLPAATLREQLENTAMERGLLFHPIANRSYEGKQVYLLERIHIYFDRNVAFHLNTQDGEWYPISLTDLLDKIS